MTRNSWNPFATMLALLNDGDGWCKGMGYDQEHQAYCLTGSVSRATLLVSRDGLTVPDDWLLESAGVILAEIIAEQFPDRVLLPFYPPACIGARAWRTVIDFNDHPRTTWPEVRTVLEKALAKWAETHP